ncbi:WD40 repeat domain-containing protein [Streptomyces sp. NPDC054933]
MTAAQGPDESPDAEERAVHARIAAGLGRLVDTGEVAPHPYVARHAAWHAALGAELNDTCLPPALLPWESSGRIRGLLGLPLPNRPDQRWLTAWAVVEPYVHAADHASRCSSLHLIYTAMCHPRTPWSQLPAEAASFTGSRVRVLWSRWSPPTNVLAAVDRNIASLCAVRGIDNSVILAIGDDLGGIELIDASTGAPLGERIAAHDGAVSSLTVLPHSTAGTVLVSGSTDGRVRIWDPMRGRLVDEAGARRESWISSVTGHTAHAGRLTLLIVSGDGTRTTWREPPSEGEQSIDPEVPLAAQETTAVAVVCGADDCLRVVTAAGPALTAHDARTGAPVGGYERASPAEALLPVTRPGHVAVVWVDGTAEVWNTTTGTRTGLEDHVVAPRVLAALRTGERHVLAAAGADNAIDLWDVTSGRRAGQLRGHTDMVTALAAIPTPAGELLASSARDNTVRLWDPTGPTAPTGGPLDDTATPRRTHAAALLTAADAPPLLALSDDTAGDIQLWDTGTGDRTVLAASGRASALAWTPSSEQGNRLLLWAADNSIHRWDAGSGTRLPPLQGHVLPVRALACCRAADGRRLALSGSEDWTVGLWDLDTGARVSRWHGHQHSVRCVAAASDGRRDWFASGGTDGTVRLWHGMDGTRAEPLRCRQGFINAVALAAHPDCMWPAFVASGGGDGTVRLWDADSGAPLGVTLGGHLGGVEAVAAWSARGQRAYVAGAARDGTVQLWDALAGRRLLVLATGSPVRTVSAHPLRGDDERVVLALGGDAGSIVLELTLGAR